MSILGTTRIKEIKDVLKSVKRALSLGMRFDAWHIIILFILAIIIGIIPYIQNGLFGKLVDVTIAYQNNQSELSVVMYTIIFLVIATSLPSILSYINNFFYLRFRFRLIRELEIYSLKKISKLDIATLESHEYQELQQKMNERGMSVIQQLISFVIDNVTNLVGIIVSIFVLGYIDTLLLCYAILGAIPALYVQAKYGKNIYWIWDLNASNRRKYFNRQGHFRSVVAAVELKVYQLSERLIGEIKKILNSFDSELEDAEKNKLHWNFFSLTTSLVFLALAMWRIVDLTLDSVLPIGQMIFAYTTYRGFNGTLTFFFVRLATIDEYSKYTNYQFQLYDLKPQITNKKNSLNVDFESNPPRIEFKNVSFRYDTGSNIYAIKNLSFTIEPGQKLAIVGLSGAGKTTLIKLLCRVYDPEDGEILINGVNLKEIDVDSWQKQLGILFQDFIGYNFTVREAIAMGAGDKPVDDHKVIEAAKKAKADTFIERLPKKYDQLLWKGFEDGVDLSRGERQRMALARVLYRESPITILDEPTSSVDALAEQEIFETLEKLPKDRSVILISHRFSTVKNTDKILVIEQGEIIEQGSHKELMQKKGKYAHLYTLQKKAYDELEEN